MSTIVRQAMRVRVMYQDRRDGDPAGTTTTHSVDGQSTADVLAYFLWSRHLDENATEGTVCAGIDPLRPIGRTERIAIESRDPITGVLLWSVTAEPEKTR